MSTHPLRQSYTIGRDFDRSTSPTSSLASSRYSSSSSFFERSRDSTSTMSSMSSNTYSIGKAASRYSYTRPGSALGNETENYGSHGYSEPGATRQYLRQLPQAPASSQPSYSSYAGGRSSFTGADSWKPRDSLDSTTGTPSPPRHLAIRPNSMVMTRSDSVRMDSPGHVRGHSVHQVPPQDLTVLGKSSTTHLRTLSRLASDEASPFDINSPAQEVVGLRGRRRLQRAGATRQQGTGSYGGGDSWGGRNWMDKQRQFLQAYEYLCHIGEAKEWIEDIIHKPIPAIVELEEALRDGVTLAEVVEALNPDRRYRIFRHPKLQFRHSDNIAIFFRYLDEVQLPDLFRFELIDLYEKKNIPKVIYCIHALSWLLFRKGIVDFRIGNLVGQLEFEHHELEAMQRGLDKLGVNMPSFGNMGADFGVEPEPEPEETEEERIERELGECEDSIVELQSLARAALVRRELGDKMNDLWDWERLVVDLQSRVRGEWAREVFNYRLQMKQFSTNLQSAIRGFLVRERFRDQFMVLDSIEGQIAELQSHIRANKVRKKMSLDKQRLEGAVKKLAAFQSQARASVVRSNFNALKMAIQQQFPEPERLQANIRGARVRREVADTLNSLDQHTDMVIKLQSLARGAMERTRQATDYDALLLEEDNVVRLQSHARRYLFAAKHKKFLEELRSNEAEIIALQSHVRALLKRSEIGSLLAELEEHEEAITELQSLAKGALVRSRFAEKKRYFQEKMKEVVKIQSFVRAKLQGQAYKSLTSGKNPPVGAVKNFVHLLNDSDFDFNEEVEFERLRKTVVQQVRQNEMLEQYIDQLDIKIALLVKNKITLDEVVRHQSNFGGHHGGVLGPAPIVSGNQFDLKALNKSSRKKLESYQQLFFTLQTQPQYLARLFRRIREQGVAEKECRKIEHLMMGLFGYAQKRREEYYLLKLIARSIREEVDSSGSVQEYIRGSFFWTKLLGNYCRSPRDRKYLRDLLGPLIRDNIIEDPDLDLESDPMQIYKAAINNEELRTGRPSRRPLDIPREHAIKDPETRELFIDHLRDLREICDQYLVALEDLLPRMPYGLRYVSRQMYESLCQYFKREQPQHHLQLVCHWLWRFYLQPALTNPESVGVIDRQLSPLQKRNLGEVAKVLGQIASGRPFGGENIYLQPLNAFVAEARERLLGITRDIISVEDAESTFDIDEFNDLYAKNKPTLYIKMADIFAIHNLVSSELPHMCPNRDDVLREIMQDLGSAKSNENEMTAAGSSDIQMFLTPKLHDIEDPDAEVKALFMETKRCVLYIIRVQTGPNLLDILVKPITPEDEQRWQALLAEDFAQGSNTRGAYSDANMIDVTAMSYYELKRTALENVMRLEQMGRISKHNLYQDILNAIALDIRTKSRRRIQRQRELEGVRLTLGNLHEKAKYLEQQRKSYDDYIEQAMMTLQNKKGKKRFLLPFTKQYNHQRELERSGRVPKFGSYKYSVRSLSERGVLVSWSGISERDWDKVNLTISCDEVGIFNIEGSRGHIQIPGASALVPIEDLLQAQFEAHQFMNLFEGNLRLNVNLLLHLLYKKFYGTQ